MDKHAQQQITHLVETLAQQLGVAAEHVYAVLVRQVVAEGYVFIGIMAFIALALIAASAITCWFSWRWFKEDGDGAALSVMVIGFFLAILAIPFVSEAAVNGLKIANPEYYAIKRIADLVKPAN